MFEVIVDAVLLHQPRDKLEVGLAVLHAVFQSRVALVQARAEIVEAAILEHLLDDVRGLHVLKDATVRCAREQPKPRTRNQPIIVQMVFQTEPFRFHQDAMENALSTVGFVGHRAGSAERFVEIDIFFFAEGIHAKLEQFGEALVAFEPRENQHILACLCVELGGAPVLGQRCHGMCLLQASERISIQDQLLTTAACAKALLPNIQAELKEHKPSQSTAVDRSQLVDVTRFPFLGRSWLKILAKVLLGVARDRVETPLEWDNRLYCREPKYNPVRIWLKFHWPN